MSAQPSLAPVKTRGGRPPVHARGQGRSFQHWLVGLAGVAATGMWIPRAGACVLAARGSFSIDPTLQGVDFAPPNAPTAIEASTSRWASEFCRGNRCVTSSCPSGANVQLQFEPPMDDHTARAQLGYMLQQVSGYVPLALESALSTIVHAPGGLDPDFVPTTFYIDVPYEEVVDLDATFELVAIDRAGNESAPSAPFHVAFDGCTHAPDLEGCLEDMKAEMSCSAVPGASEMGGWAALAVAGVALSRRRRAEATTRNVPRRAR